MTAIAYRDGVLAGDSSIFQGQIYAGQDQKIWRLGDGRLYGASGRTADVEACRLWLENGSPPEKRPAATKEEWFAALLIGPLPGEVCKIEWDMRPFKAPKAEFWAIGCHFEFLLGAMAAGASAEEAVSLACRYGDGADEPVQVMRLEVRS